MKRIRSLTLALGLIGAGGAALAATGLVATPNPVQFTGKGGLSYFKSVTLTDFGPGFASNLNVTLVHDSGTTGEVWVYSDTCTGATLAPNGTCTVKLEFDAGCPKAGSTSYTLVVTSSTFPTLNIPVTASTQTGICQ
jgi:hypothetical protein